MTLIQSPPTPVPVPVPALALARTAPTAGGLRWAQAACMAVNILFGAASGNSHAAASTTPATPAQMNQLYTEYWDEFLADNPIDATFNGDKRFNDRFGPTTSAEERAKARSLAEKYLARTALLDPAALKSEDRISYDLLRYRLQRSLDALEFPEHVTPVNQMSSLPLTFAQLGSGRSAQPFATVKDYDNWLARAAGFAPAVDGMILDMREGMRTGVVLPKALVKPMLPQLDNMATPDLDKNVYMGPVKAFPASFTEADKARLTAAFGALVRERIVPAQQRLHSFLRDTYLPAARDTVGMSALPNGAAWYAHLAKSATTTDLSPQAMHTLGVSEVARIRKEFEAARERVGFKGSLKEFFNHMNSAPELRFTRREDIQVAYENLRARVNDKVPALFTRVPKTAFEIRPIEAFREVNGPPAQYHPGVPDGSRPGIFYYNAYKPDTRTRFTTTVFFLHEAIPGHHFEISLAQEQLALPDFRRFGYTTAFSEGWGLYCEMLGKEMGLYDDPWQWVGRLSAEAWRAVRLVVDTGIHAKGWSREQAIAYFLDNVPQSETVATQEVERYIAIPGQALSYKIGELKLRELRTRAETVLGPKFDIRAFHEEVLAHGSVPLSVLEAAVDRWLAAQAK